MPESAARARVLLVVPPLTGLIIYPELSVPALVAALRARGRDARQADLNLAMAYEWLPRPEVAADAVARLSPGGRRHLAAIAPYLVAERARLHASVAGGRTLDARAGERVTDLVRRYLDQRESLSPALPEVLLAYAGGGAVFEPPRGPAPDPLAWLMWMDLVRREFLAPAGWMPADVGAAASSPGPFFDAFLTVHLDPLLADGPSIVGVSIHETAQLVPALRIARRVRERLPAAHVVLGGPWCVAAADVVRNHPIVLDFADAVATGEGEDALSALADAVDAGSAWDAIPGLLFRRPDGAAGPGGPDGAVADTGPARPVPLADLPPPCFDGLPLDRYPVPGVPFRTVRGCYWSRCLFCCHVPSAGAGAGGGDEACAADRGPDAVEDAVIDALVATVRDAAARGVRRLALADHATPPGVLARVASALLGAGLRVDWQALVRFDPAFDDGLFRVLARSGCRELHFGLETSSPAELTRLRKGIAAPIVDRCLAGAAAAGIEASVFVLEYPSQPAGEYAATLDFVCERRATLGWLNPARFQLGRNTTAYAHPATLGLRLPPEAASWHDPFDVPFEADGWDPDPAEWQRVTEDAFVRIMTASTAMVLSVPS